MNWTRRTLFGIAATGLWAQEPAVEPEVEFVCPMDPDVRSKTPSSCPRCGMKLVAGLPSFAEYRLVVTAAPRRIRPNEPAELRFRVLDPKTKQTAKLQVIHEKLFHLFVIRQDLGYFAHEHPEPQSDGSFTFRAVFPTAGAYRLGCDIYPQGGAPQLLTQTVIVPGGPARFDASLRPSPLDQPRQFGGLTVRLRTEPEEPIAGKKTMLFYEVTPGERIEPWLGAMGHLLVASPDLVDLVHTHPFLVTGPGRLQFNVIFPRPGVHRVWMQMQNAGEVITTSFDVAVRSLT